MSENKITAKPQDSLGASYGVQGNLAQALYPQGRYDIEFWEPKPGRQADCEALAREIDKLQNPSSFVNGAGRALRHFGLGLTPRQRHRTAARLQARMRGMQQLAWRETITNLVPTGGANDMLDKYLSGSSYTAAWYLGLVDGGSTPSYNNADTMASHSGWTENVTYSNSTRPAPSFSSAASRAKTTSAAVAFNINGTATIAGAFLTGNSTKSGTTGILFSAGNFTGGNQPVSSGGTLNVTYTLTLT